MNRHYREDTGDRKESRRIEHSEKDHYSNLDTQGLDAIMSGKKRAPDTDTSKTEGNLLNSKSSGYNSGGKKYVNPHNEAKPFEETTYYKKGGQCKKMHMAAGGVGKIRHDQYY